MEWRAGRKLLLGTHSARFLALYANTHDKSVSCVSPFYAFRFHRQLCELLMDEYRLVSFPLCLPHSYARDAQAMTLLLITTTRLLRLSFAAFSFSYSKTERKGKNSTRRSLGVINHLASSSAPLGISGACFLLLSESCCFVRHFAIAVVRVLQ